jgi:hypothetical protein
MATFFVYIFIVFIVFILQKFDDMWDIIDSDATSFVEFDVFIRHFLGEMSEKRKKIVRKVKNKLTLLGFQDDENVFTNLYYLSISNE